MGFYEVPGMTEIKQKKVMSCWYASAQMVLKWRQDMDSQSSSATTPELDAISQKIRDDDQGLANPQILAMAKRLGLEAVPPLSPTVDTLEHWLKLYGPLWVNGKTHIVVMAGIDTAAITVKIYDPNPHIAVSWRSLMDWYAFGTSPSTRDTGSDVEAVFLYAPG